MATAVQSTNSSLPMDIQQKLQELELELAEGIRQISIFIFYRENFSILGDITQKGFEKKRIKLLAPYQQQQTSNSND